MREGGMSNPGYYITLLFYIYVCVGLCVVGLYYFTDVSCKGRLWIVFVQTGRDERQINEDLCTQTQCALCCYWRTQCPQTTETLLCKPSAHIFFLLHLKS
jgi:hypothetical protein